MSYSLNGILLSDYKIVPIQPQGSNISVEGIFDLPKRIGQTYQIWDEENTVEPFVDADEINLGGRSIIFHGAIFQDNDLLMASLKRLKLAIESFTNLVIFSTPFGDFSVKVERVEPITGNQHAKLKIYMREPNPDLTGGVLPATGLGSYSADRILLSSFGMYVSSVKGRESVSEINNEYFTAYVSEGYQVSGRKPNEITISGAIIANSLIDFQANIKALWKLFTDPGTRKVRLNDFVTIESFCTDGFTVSGVYFNSEIIANITVKLVSVTEYIQVYVTADANGKILTTEDHKILVYG